MASNIRVVPVAPVAHAELAGLFELACSLGVELRSAETTEPACLDAENMTALAALRLENGLWLFCIDALAGPQAQGTPCAQEEQGALALGKLGAEIAPFAARCRTVFAWPRDRTSVGHWLTRSAGGPVQEVGAQAPEPAHEAARQIGLIGRSPRFSEALCLAVRLARYDVSVLLEGETGTGKELFARALHYLGPRRARPFVPLNCGALPDSLLESQLFGHLRGVFTDARSELRGLVAQAEGGTLFFDEVHCLSPKGQMTLLRFVQDQLYRPLGAEQLRRADVRIVAATNRPLADEVSEGRFREDLYYRLDVAGLRLPPLRERREDIPLLVESAVARLCARFKTGPRHFDAASLAWLATRDWRGNVRELENYVCRQFLMSDDEVIHLEGRRGDLAEGASRLAPEPAPCAAYKVARAQVLADFETRYLRTMLALTHGNVTEAARQSGKERRVFGRLMRKYGIDRREFG